ncbi:HAD family hydrolase [Salinibacillus xinjiangensis]|uniref:HAD-IA family hydrolase n=1 Tax=Salinibacillus xinjiangensis TaxID=1229268 RepID=A0A6G1X8E5_9BACI|nr:HAD family hydrolase [Salinibacillus xinjiangensis]MRG87175.1 HAD-IA family hydrolase [Salinibacillus xinjiangensis]
MNRNSENIKSVLFDLDGTLLNREQSVKSFTEKQYERLYKWVGHVPKDKYVSRFIELDEQGYVWKDKVYQQLIKEYKIIGLTWENLLQDYIQHFKYSCIPYPNLMDMLAELKTQNLALGMITNGKGQFQMDNIKTLGIEKYFDTILISEWEGLKKPEPQIFNKALEQLNVLPSESIFVGDHPEKDVKAAQNVGMKGIWKKNEHWGDVEADMIVDELMEIPSYIRALKSLEDSI